MSFVNIGNNIILDTGTLKLFDKKYVKNESEIKDIKDVKFTIEENELGYRLYIEDSIKTLYYGTFNDIKSDYKPYDVDIYLADKMCNKNYILLYVRMDFFSNLGIEVPLVMFNVIKIPITDIKHGAELLVFNNTPIYLYDSELNIMPPLNACKRIIKLIDKEEMHFKINKNIVSLCGTSFDISRNNISIF